jgi:CubicO group peptidase (beta-lactamase class C family)
VGKRLVIEALPFHRVLYEGTLLLSKCYNFNFRKDVAKAEAESCTLGKYMYRSLLRCQHHSRRSITFIVSPPSYIPVALMFNIPLFLSILTAPIAVLAQCPPHGPTLPLATNLANNPVIKKTVQGINAELKKKIGSLKSTAFAVTLGTINGDTPLLEFHNAPTVYNTSGSHTLTTDTQFVVASISKLFTAYGIKLLSDKVSPNDCVAKYIPELLHLQDHSEPQNPVTSTDWSDVTIDALLSHLSGIAEDLGDSDIDNAPGNYSALGLPTLNKTEQGTQCGDAFNPYQRPCNEADFFNNWGRKYPVYAPYTTPVYSNIGYAILGLVIERATGKSYAQYMEEAIFQPLGLKHTSVDQPISLSEAFITKETGDGDISEEFLAR